MEKQIMIKHSSNDRTVKIKNIISYLELFVDSPNDNIIFNCCLKENQSKIIDEIMHLDNVDISNVETDKKFHKYDIVIGLDNVVHFLDLIENYELNVMAYCNDIKMFINDNDGDFIIINSNHKKYYSIKNKKQKYQLLFISKN